ncbi:TlpA family protein disulfide reductase [Anaerotignum sp.]|uniref:TlpA family protein disulfide reductase n=1 Tax=Anaerotignum sp. TaxID=2039241 RepID=UPI0027149222|nr:TlpA disulfide reductase family protein [Anaerotignum sp.]
MRKKIALFLALLLSLNMLGGCGKEDTPEPTDGAEELKTNYRFEQCGLAYRLPKEWLQRDNVNLIPVTFVDVAGAIYAKIEYDYTPNENMDELNNIDSQTPVEELMIPIFTLLVIRDENVDSQAMKDELALFKNCEELPAQEGFHFYYLTDYIGSTPKFSEDSAKMFDTLKSELPSLRQTVETFPPDESTVQAQVAEDKEHLNFMSTTLKGDPITSTVFYDYDLTVINFWASYCYPDINELTTLQTFYEQLKQKYTNINFVQVVIDTPGEEAEKVVEQAYQEAGVTFTTIVPDQNMASWIIDNLNGLPTTIFVDNTGKPFSTKIEGVQDLDYYMETTQSMLEKIKTGE